MRVRVWGGRPRPPASIMSNLSIHPATRDDVPALLSLIRGLAAYEKKPQAVVATEQRSAARRLRPAPEIPRLDCPLEWQARRIRFVLSFLFDLSRAVCIIS